MCLSVPGKVISVHEDRGMRMANVDFGGVCKEACLEHVLDAAPGDYVLVHVGFALSRIDEAEAQRVFALLRQLGEASELGELTEEPPSARSGTEEEEADALSR
jgi:hydrogenase expression/formation protein HypC